MKNAILILLIMLICVSCRTKSIYSFSLVDSIKYETLDSMLLSKNVLLGKEMENNEYKCLLFYLTTNECAECLSNMIDFNKVINASNSFSSPAIIWVTGVDSILMEYYTNQDYFELSKNTVFCIDQEDAFHSIFKCMYTNMLFIVQNNKKIYSIKSESPIYEWNIKDILENIPNKDAIRIQERYD